MKKKVMLIVTIIILILLATFGASVALYNGVRIGSKESSISVGDLTFKYTEVTGIGNGISLEDADAISDAEGKGLTTWFDFKIDANLVNSDMIYEVSVEPTNESTINLDGVKIYLTELVGNEEVDINSNYNGLGKVKVISDYDNGIIYQERILKNTKNYEKNFRVRIWISEDVDIYTDGYMGTKGVFKINVNAKSDISMVDATIPVPEITGGTGNDVSVRSATISVLDYNPAIYGIDHYEYYITEDLEDIPTDLTIKTGDTDNQLLINTDGIKYIYYRSVTKNNEKSAWSNMQKVNKKSIWDFEFDPDGDGQGQVQAFTVPCNGNYQLEVWGASGGDATGGDGLTPGGKGGYSSGLVNLNTSEKIYITVGGGGNTTSSFNNYTIVGNGYNGGGATAIQNYVEQCGASGGGGATHIGKTQTLLKNTSLSDLYIVAGGGGGSAVCFTTTKHSGSGGAGGGLTGITGTPSTTHPGSNALGGTQSVGGTNSYNPRVLTAASYGTGCIPVPDTSVSPNLGYMNTPGGGGLYGGACGTHGGGGGGSSYIGGVTNGSTIAGNASMPTHDGTSTMVGNTGNGYAKITLKSISE